MIRPYSLQEARRASRFFARLHKYKHNGRDFLSYPGVTRRKGENFLDYIVRVYAAFPSHPFKRER